ncbi:hypothetical protein LQW54_000103 [Pestalotiopsis sp. IQ-011]
MPTSGSSSKKGSGESRSQDKKNKKAKAPSSTVVECSSTSDLVHYEDTNAQVESVDEYNTTYYGSETFSNDQDYVLQYVGSQFDGCEE